MKFEPHCWNGQEPKTLDLKLTIDGREASASLGIVVPAHAERQLWTLCFAVFDHLQARIQGSPNLDGL